MLEQLLKSVPNICSTDAQLVMMEQYETLFGIYDHLKRDASNPFAVVALHPAEDNFEYSILRERMEQFAYHKVTEAFGLSWLEYLSLPCYEASEILQISALKRTKEEQTQNNILNNLPKGMLPK